MWTIKVSPDLRRYSIYVEPSLHVVACLSCCKTIHLDHVRTHLVSDHGFKKVPKQDDLAALLLELGALPTWQIDFPTYPVPPIVGIDVVEGFQCLEEDCEHVSTSIRSRNEHFQLKHTKKHGNGEAISYATIPLQSLYGFKGDRVVFKVLPNKPKPSTSGGYEKYMEQVATRKPIDPLRFDSHPTKNTNRTSYRSRTGVPSLTEKILPPFVLSSSLPSRKTDTFRY